jgi:sigma-B regulation protein RsbU (phosphoserine phosphatase)
LRPDGRIATANATLARWLGHDVAALMGRPVRDLLTTPGRIIFETNLAPALRIQGGFEEVILDLLTASGEKIPVTVSATVQRDEHGDLILSHIAVFRSPDRRSYEGDLQTRAATAAKGLADERETAQLREQFIAVLGHDLRNPLASIVGAARLLRREVQSEKAVRVLDLMETSVDRMAGLIDDVMDFARGRLGSGIDLNRQTALLEPVLLQVVAELEACHPGRSVEIEIDAAEPISFDAGRLGQLASNLLGNAISHGDPKTTIWLHAITGEGELTLSVANGGSPIPQAAMAKLFQPFFRGEVRRSQQGLGLGLHIASEIAKAHGGTLGVSSDEAETRFTFRMPLANDGTVD